MPTPTILFLFEPHLLPATASIMRVLGSCMSQSRHRIIVRSTILLTAFPTPRATTAGADTKLAGSTSLQSTRKHICARRILQAPALTPRTHLRIVQTHSFYIGAPK